MRTKNVVQLPTTTERFYRRVLEILHEAGHRFLIGGSLALMYYMHLGRRPKDLDIFVKKEDCLPILTTLAASGFRTEVMHEHWLAKIWQGELFIDLIFSSGNGVAKVDDSWFEQAYRAALFGVPVTVCSPEDILWSKAFVMDRERFDGADIAHLLHDAGAWFDWQRLIDRFEHHWRVLLAHLLLTQFIYPTEKIVPRHVLQALIYRVQQEADYASEVMRLCQGTLLSRDQYLSDIEVHGYEDGRVLPYGNLSPQEAAIYTQQIRLQPKAA